LLVIVAPFVAYAVPQVVGADQGYVVLSGSMEPVMSPGDVIIVDSVGVEAIQEGDIITYTQGDERTPTTHRVIEIVERDGGVAFRTKGDANGSPDSQLVSPDQVEGEVMTIGGYLLVIPYIGYVIQFMQTTPGFVALFVVPLVLLVVSELWNIVKSSKSDARTEPVDGEEAMATETGGEDPDAAPADAEAEHSPPASTGDVAIEDIKADEEGFVFSALELQLGLGALGAFLAYSLWVTYAAIEIFESGVIWASGATAAVAVTFLLFLSLYVSGRRGGETENDTSSSVEPTAKADGGGDTPDEDLASGTPTPDGGATDESDDFDWQTEESDPGRNDTGESNERSKGGKANE
jgi:signal peptidase